MNKKDKQQADTLQRKINKVLAAKKDLAVRLSRGKYSRGVRDEAERVRKEIHSATRLKPRNAPILSEEARRQIAFNEAVALRFRGGSQ